MKRITLISIICTLLVVLWVYAAGSKLSEYRVFIDQLKRQPLPSWSVNILVWALPIVELLTAVLIFFQRTRMKGLIISAFLMISFTLYVAFALSGAFGEIPCSCAGLISSLKWQGHLIFNIIFTIISLLGLYFQRHKEQLFRKHKPMAV